MQQISPIFGGKLNGLKKQKYINNKIVLNDLKDHLSQALILSLSPKLWIAKQSHDMRWSKSRVWRKQQGETPSLSQVVSIVELIAGSVQWSAV